MPDNRVTQILQCIHADPHIESTPRETAIKWLGFIPEKEYEKLPEAWRVITQEIEEE